MNNIDTRESTVNELLQTAITTLLLLGQLRKLETGESVQWTAQVAGSIRAFKNDSKREISTLAGDMHFLEFEMNNSDDVNTWAALNIAVNALKKVVGD